MRVLSLAWVGTRTTEYAATVAFFREVLGLGVHSSETDFTVLEEAVAELRAAGAEIVLDPQGGDDRSWVHFRAPDGFVYELAQDTSA